MLKFIIVSGLAGLLTAGAPADEDLTLIDIITFPELDSARITSITNAGDFNADGYDDLLIGIFQNLRPECYEAAYLYYGGPAFDTEADLVFYEDQEGQEENSGFCMSASGLGDFDGDGYDDIAIAEPNWGGSYGRIDIYFGSPESDTIIDLLIYAEEWHDYLGWHMISGDFNGDGLGDIFTYANGTWLPWSRALIYSGNNPPDGEYDFIYDSTYIDRYTDDGGIFGGSDVNDDGLDDFGWHLGGIDGDSILFFLGSSDLDNQPDFIATTNSISLIGDITDDAIDDIIMRQGWALYICEGGVLFDLEPDHYMWSDPPYCAFPVVYDIPGIGPKLIAENISSQQFLLFNTGVPFDSIPYAVYNYPEPRMSSLGAFLGDINADNNVEFAMIHISDSLTHEARVYSMITTGVEEDYGNNTPQRGRLLGCYPNPFNSTTTISYSGLDGNYIKIYNITGSLVKTLRTENNSIGTVNWDATDDAGRSVCSGVYFIRAQTAEGILSAKLIYLK